MQLVTQTTHSCGKFAGDRSCIADANEVIKCDIDSI